MRTLLILLLLGVSMGVVMLTSEPVAALPPRPTMNLPHGTAQPSMLNTAPMNNTANVAQLNNVFFLRQHFHYSANSYSSGYGNYGYGSPYTMSSYGGYGNQSSSYGNQGSGSGGNQQTVPAYTRTPYPWEVQAMMGPTVQVGLYDDAYQPMSMTISAGVNVSWMNYGSHNHTVTADNQSWDSGLLAPGQTYNLTFKVRGIYTYHCILHPKRMQGTIIVE